MSVSGEVSSSTVGAGQAGTQWPQATAQGVVSTIQAVRSPVWSVPSVSEGNLSVGGEEVENSSAPSYPSLPHYSVPSTHPNLIPTSPGGKRVVVKPLSFMAPTAGLGLGGLLPGPVGGAGRRGAGSPSKGASQLAELASQLTPAQAQTIDNLLHSVKQLSASRSPSQPNLATPTQPLQHLAKNKPLMPKNPLSLPPSIPPSLGTLAQPAPSVPPHKVVAPVAIPPAPILPPATLLPPLPAVLPPTPPSLPQDFPSRPSIRTNKPRKPCHCKNSQCLKLYCDCFANGEFCREGCQCLNCKNNMHHAEDRARAVKICLDRNPHAFKPKVGPNKSGDVRRHVKGCNCKRSGCLKNYCECYEAKIPCSALCRCVGCRNLPEKLENKSLMQLADAADIRTQQQKAATSHLLEQLDLTSSKPEPQTRGGQRLPFSFINKEVAKATCLCLLEEASHMLMSGKTLEEVERVVLEEFGRCMNQIISSAQSASESNCRSSTAAVQ